MSALVNEIVWRLTRDKPLSESMMTKIANACMQYQASMCKDIINYIVQKICQLRPMCFDLQRSIGLLTKPFSGAFIIKMSAVI